MHTSRLNPFRARTKRPDADFGVERQRLRNPSLDAEPTRSPLDALARGLVAIGDRLKPPPALRLG